MITFKRDRRINKEEQLHKNYIPIRSTKNNKTLDIKLGMKIQPVYKKFDSQAALLNLKSDKSLVNEPIQNKRHSLNKTSSRFVSTSPKKFRKGKVNANRQNFPNESEFNKIKKNAFSRKGSQNAAGAKNLKVDLALNLEIMKIRECRESINKSIKNSNTFDKRNKNKSVCTFENKKQEFESNYKQQSPNKDSYQNRARSAKRSNASLMKGDLDFNIGYYFREAFIRVLSSLQSKNQYEKQLKEITKLNKNPPENEVYEEVAQNKTHVIE